MVGGGDEHQAASRDDWSAVVLTARVRQSLLDEIGIFSQRDLPRVLTGVQVDGIQGPPRRRDRGIVVGIEKLPVAGETEVVVDPWIDRAAPTATIALAAAAGRNVFTREHELRDRIDRSPLELWKGRHSTAALPDHGHDIRK